VILISASQILLIPLPLLSKLRLRFSIHLSIVNSEELELCPSCLSANHKLTPYLWVLYLPHMVISLSILIPYIILIAAV